MTESASPFFAPFRLGVFHQLFAVLGIRMSGTVLTVLDKMIQNYCSWQYLFLLLLMAVLVFFIAHGSTCFFYNCKFTIKLHYLYGDLQKINTVTVILLSMYYIFFFTFTDTISILYFEVLESYIINDAHREKINSVQEIKS